MVADRNAVFGKLAAHFTHPLLKLFPVPDWAPPEALELQSLVAAVLDIEIGDDGRLQAARELRRRITTDGVRLATVELVTEVIAISHMLKPSAALFEQLIDGRLKASGWTFSVPSNDRQSLIVELPFLEPIISFRKPRDDALETSGVAERLKPFLRDIGLCRDAELKSLAERDVQACLRLLLLHLLEGERLDPTEGPHARLAYLDSEGGHLWDRLAECLPTNGNPIFRPGTRLLVRRQIEDELGPPTTTLDVDKSTGACTATHVIAMEPFPAASDRSTRETLARYERLRSPLPVSRLPLRHAIDASIARLHAEFPWATAAVEAVSEDLRAKAAFGALELTLPPVLLFGAAGCGKSRLARRLAEEFRLPFLALSLAGTSDSRVLLGTTRGWADAAPSPLINFLRDRASASAMILVDEIEKAGARASNSMPPEVALLNLLEPENAARWFDTFLLVPCNLSKLTFWATANDPGRLSKPLLSRFRLIYVPEPKQAHYSGIIDVVLQDLAKHWGLPDDALKGLPIAHELRKAKARNVRELKGVVRSALAAWVKSDGLVRH